MAEKGSRSPASDETARENTFDIYQEMLGGGRPRWPGMTARTQELRDELSAKGLKGFKKGGKVKKTGVYKLHKGEKVVPANRVKQEARDKALLSKTRYR